jgi:hypothetical protein
VHRGHPHGVVCTDEEEDQFVRRRSVGDGAKAEAGKTSDHHRLVAVNVNQRTDGEERECVAEHRRGDGEPDDGARRPGRLADGRRRGEGGIEAGAGSDLPAQHNRRCRD